MDELHRLATKFTQLEELQDYWNQVRIKTGAEREKDKGKGKEKGNRSTFGKNMEAREPHFQHYTPLNTDRGQVLEEALNANLLPPQGRYQDLTMPT